MVHKDHCLPRYGANFLLRRLTSLWQNARLLDGVVLAWLLHSSGRVIANDFY